MPRPASDVLDEVVCERPADADGARLACLRIAQLAVPVRLADQQLAERAEVVLVNGDIRPVQRERLAGPEARVRHQGDEDAVADARHVRADPLDLVWCERPTREGWLWDSAEAEARVRREPASFDGRRERRTEGLHGEVHRPRLSAVADDPGAPLDDALPAQVAEPDTTELRPDPVSDARLAVRPSRRCPRH